MGRAHRLSVLCCWGKSAVRKRAIASAALTLSFGRLAEAQSWPCVYAATEAFARGPTACSAGYAPQWWIWTGRTLSRVMRLLAIGCSRLRAVLLGGVSHVEKKCDLTLQNYPRRFCKVVSQRPPYML